MNNTLRCGHAGSAANTYREYGYVRCRTCRRAANRRSERKRRAEFNARRDAA
jgi:hypothetical protein